MDKVRVTNNTYNKNKTWSCKIRYWYINEINIVFKKGLVDHIINNKLHNLKSSKKKTWLKNIKYFIQSL